MRVRSALLLASVVLAIGGLSSACSESGGNQTAQAPAIPQVPVAQVVVRELAPSTEFNGSLSAPQSVELRPRVSGTIVSVHVPEGALVRKGQLLFRIDPRPFEVALDQAQAQLRQAQATAALAESNFTRSEQLVSTGAISRKVYDDAVAQRNVARAQVEAGNAAVAAARLDLSFTQVTAPISGRVDRVLVTAGNVVGAGANAAPLTTIKSVSPLHVLFDIDEATYLNFIEQARRGGSTARLPVQIGLLTEQGYPHSATLDFLGNGIDRTAGTIRARAVVANPDGDLAPGLFARVKLTLDAPQQTILIEDQAVGSDQGKNYVLVVGQGNKAEYRPIELGPVVDGLRVVKVGLKPDDSIIVKGLVRPGMQIASRKVSMVQDEASGAGDSNAPAAEAAPAEAGQ
ncbi:MAG TPA: efflux RND transporter periplasmic adaptor subunit [Pedomonas sp.]|uniref:efflux RND transporter periplasmic adaptor subunit n=1 Tax=Pedomonas sp. TaxID=2976421 RepID=UPI002F418A85